jgi:starch phosphorylase
VQLARRPEFRRRIVLIEDYDQVVGRYLVQGADVWLNTPRRPMEASGTSGMKAAFNGALNLSTLDGWWDEAHAPGTGWAIGTGEEYVDHQYQDKVEANALYDLLEHEVVPLFYRRGADNLPRGWIALMRSSIGHLCPVFNTNRMLHQYLVEGYLPAERRRARLEENDYARAKNLARWKQQVRAGWPQVRIVRTDVSLPPSARVGDRIDVRAWIETGRLAPTDMTPQIQAGRLLESRDIIDPVLTPMVLQEARPGEPALFSGSFECQASGTVGLTVRVVPAHEDLAHPHETGLIVWAS